jgi:hypothetical protein
MASIRTRLNRMIAKIEAALMTGEKAAINLSVFLNKPEVSERDVRALLGLDLVDRAAQWEYQRAIQHRLNAMGCSIDMDLGSRAPEDIAHHIPRLWLHGLHKQIVEATITQAKADILADISEYFDESLLTDAELAPQFRAIVDCEFAEAYGSEEIAYQSAKLPYRPDDLWVMYLSDCLGSKTLLGREWDLPESRFLEFLDADYRRGWLNYLLRAEDQFAERSGHP